MPIPVRVVETTCGQRWPDIRHELERMRLGTFEGPAGTLRQRTEITAPRRVILAKLELAEPPRIHELAPAAASS